MGNGATVLLKSPRRWPGAAAATYAAVSSSSSSSSSAAPAPAAAPGQEAAALLEASPGRVKVDCSRCRSAVVVSAGALGYVCERCGEHGRVSLAAASRSLRQQLLQGTEAAKVAIGAQREEQEAALVESRAALRSSVEATLKSGSRTATGADVSRARALARSALSEEDCERAAEMLLRVDMGTKEHGRLKVALHHYLQAKRRRELCDRLGRFLSLAVGPSSMPLVDVASLQPLVVEAKGCGLVLHKAIGSLLLTLEGEAKARQVEEDYQLKLRQRAAAAMQSASDDAAAEASLRALVAEAKLLGEDTSALDSSLGRLLAASKRQGSSSSSTSAATPRLSARTSNNGEAWSEDDFSSLRVAALKEELQKRGVSCEGVFEKEVLVGLLRKAVKNGGATETDVQAKPASRGATPRAVWQPGEEQCGQQPPEIRHPKFQKPLPQPPPPMPHTTPRSGAEVGSACSATSPRLSREACDRMVEPPGNSSSRWRSRSFDRQVSEAPPPAAAAANGAVGPPAAAKLVRPSTATGVSGKPAGASSAAGAGGTGAATSSRRRPMSAGSFRDLFGLRRPSSGKPSGRDKKPAETGPAAAPTASATAAASAAKVAPAPASAAAANGAGTLVTSPRSGADPVVGPAGAALRRGASCHSELSSTSTDVARGHHGGGGGGAAWRQQSRERHEDASKASEASASQTTPASSSGQPRSMLRPPLAPLSTSSSSIPGSVAAGAGAAASVSTGATGGGASTAAGTAPTANLSWAAAARPSSAASARRSAVAGNASSAGNAAGNSGGVAARVKGAASSAFDAFLTATNYPGAGDGDSRPGSAKPCRPTPIHADWERPAVGSQSSTSTPAASTTRPRPAVSTSTRPSSAPTFSPTFDRSSRAAEAAAAEASWRGDRSRPPSAGAASRSSSTAAGSTAGTSTPAGSRPTSPRRSYSKPSSPRGRVPPPPPPRTTPPPPPPPPGAPSRSSTTPTNGAPRNCFASSRPPSRDGSKQTTFNASHNWQPPPPPPPNPPTPAGGSRGASQRSHQQQEPPKGANSSQGLTRPAALACLGLTGKTESEVTSEDLKKAYKKQALRWHPDRQQNHGCAEEAKQRFQEVKAAFDLLAAPAMSRQPTLHSAAGGA
eukprot:TRINITY_DN49102_c0_g1_i1.p1 TRINITY_DN49102_c0_g1~~TRINITY_DN49102_c0_g1_i1.p1  ORF type:complete len:1122 (-),score=242.06 TRINITY_DN49102_c0_g1_i1:161-3526(-)